VLNGVIFDMDGVIVDSHRIHMKAWKEFLFSKGRLVTDLDLDFVRDGRKKQDILRHFLGDLTEDQIQLYGYQKELLFREEANNMATIPGFRRLLDELNRAGIPMAVGSSGSRGRVHYLLNLLHLRKYFAAVVTAEDVVLGKPDPAIFCKASRDLRVRPMDSLVIEDSISGVLAAKAAGMKCLGIADRRHTHALLQAGASNVLPNFMHASLSEMQSLFN
jgi:HAD superfamily hydrolase (TIGR01509 family)